MPERARRVAAVAWLFLTAVFLLAQYRDRYRSPHVDETQYLHAALRMDRGDEIFVDFSEHHSPLFFALLTPFAPDANGVEAMQGFLLRARLFAVACTAAAVAFALLLVHRASGRAAVPVIAAGLMLGAGPVWRNGLADVRAESPGLALWWGGTALVLLARRGWLRGLGLGLVFLAALVNPKWPLASIVVGIVFLIDCWRDVKAIVIAVAVAFLGVAAVALFSDIPAAVFHVFEMTTASRNRMAGALQAEDLATLAWFARCARILRPHVVLTLALAAAAAWPRIRGSFASPRLAMALFAIAFASLGDLRFIHPYPSLDYRAYAQWVIVAAALLALVVQAAEALLVRQTAFARVIAPAMAAIALLLAIDIVQPERPRRDVYWQSSAWIEQRLQPGETVWLATPRHPIGAADASYYWFGFGDVVPPALDAATTPRGRKFLPPLTERDLPPCRLERGLDRHLRFLERPPHVLPVARACFDRLHARGSVVHTPVPSVWTVVR